MLLKSIRACSRFGEPGRIRPQTKMPCKDESAVEVIGPVDRGERMMAKKGARRIVRSTSLMSAIRQAISVGMLGRVDSPSTLWMVRFNS